MITKKNIRKACGRFIWLDMVIILCITIEYAVYIGENTARRYKHLKIKL